MRKRIAERLRSLGARRHGIYERWILEEVVPAIHADCGGPQEIVTAGVSLGAFHAVNFALKRADLFPRALGLSGNYDPSTWDAWGERGEAAYFNNPMHSLAHAHGDHLDWLRSRLTVQLVCGQGRWEDTTGALESTRRFAHLLGKKGIRHELDLWGADVAHDWPGWRAQLAHHLHASAEGPISRAGDARSGRLATSRSKLRRGPVPRRRAAGRHRDHRPPRQRHG